MASSQINFSFIWKDFYVKIKKNDKEKIDLISGKYFSGRIYGKYDASSHLIAP